jgi:hypothetical protein
MAGIDWEPGEAESITLAPAASPSLRDVLETVAEFGEASAGLVAWDLCVSEQDLQPAWEQAVRERLIKPAHQCSETGEMMYRLMRFPGRRSQGT